MELEMRYLAILVLILTLGAGCATAKEQRRTGGWIGGAGALVALGGISLLGGTSGGSSSEEALGVSLAVVGAGAVTALTGMVIYLAAKENHHEPPSDSEELKVERPAPPDGAPQPDPR